MSNSGRGGFYGWFVLSTPSTRLVAASGCSNLGDGLWAVALPLLAAAVTADPFAVAAVFAAGQVPWLAVAVWGGGVIDRRNRVDLLRWVNALRVLMVLGLATSAAVGVVGVGLLIIAALLIGTCEAMVDTATEALVPAVAHDTELNRVNGRLLSAQIAGNELVGPALGGVLFAAAAWVPLFANAALLMAAVALLLTIPSLLGIVHRTNDTTATRWSDGFTMLRRDVRLRAITWASVGLAAIDAAWFGLLVLVVDSSTSLGSIGFGLLLAVGAAGGLLGAAIAERRPDLRLSRIGGSALIAIALCLWLLATVPGVPTTAVVLATTSGVFALWNVSSTTARQTIVPAASLGRVAASFRGVSIAAAIAGALLGGWIAAVGSLTVALVIAGVAAWVAAVPVAKSLSVAFAT